jgi:hypothetical protein
MDTSSVAASTRLVGNNVGRNLINIYRSNIYIEVIYDRSNLYIYICKTGVKQEKSIYTCIYLYIYIDHKHIMHTYYIPSRSKAGVIYIHIYTYIYI